MAPPIRHAKTWDGVRVSYHTLGDGPAVVMLVPYHVNHLALNWDVALHRGAIEFFARYFTVINLDFRGAGLSERCIGALSLATFAADLDAVLAALSMERVALLAIGSATVVACHIAETSPDRVSSLVSIEGGASEANRRVLSLRHIDLQVEANMRGSLISGIQDRHSATSLAAVAHDALEEDALQYWEDLLDGTDLLGIAARVAAPTLYVNVSHDQVIPLAAAQALVDRMTHSTLITVPGRSPIDVWRDRMGVGCKNSNVLESTGPRLVTPDASIPPCRRSLILFHSLSRAFLVGSTSSSNMSSITLQRRITFFANSWVTDGSASPIINVVDSPPALKN